MVTQQAPSLSTGQHLSVGALASSGGVCCSHLPSSAQILISTSSLPLLALPWRPLWIFPRQTFLRGLSAHVQLRPPHPRERGGHLGPHGGVKEAARFPGLLWAGSKCLEGSGKWGQCPLTQDCQEEGRKHTGDEGLLVNFNASGRFGELLCCCPEHTEVLGHASQTPILSSYL